MPVDSAFSTFRFAESIPVFMKWLGMPLSVLRVVSLAVVSPGWSRVSACGDSWEVATALVPTRPVALEAACSAPDVRKW